MSNPAWLSAPSLRLDAHGDAAFGGIEEEAAAALSGTTVTPLLQLGAIRAAGAEADTFLQNQLSNDLRQLVPAHVQLATYNSPKGRVLDLFALRRDGDAIVLEARRDTLPATLKRLRMFVLRAKVTLEEAAGYCALGLAGPQAAELLAGAGLPVPAQDWDCAAAGDLAVIRRPGTVERYTVHAGAERLRTLWPALAQQAVPVGTAAWRLLDILAGLPSIRPATADHFVAQMLNLDRLGAISFSKGCYPGQEIVARMHYLGNLKRRMFRAHTAAAGVVPGSQLYAAGGDGQAVGEVVDAAPCTEGTALLAVLQLGQSGAILRLGNPEGAMLELMDGPES
ncbi:MAG: hypothetical protein P4L83_18495 [Nevskia sp.]|nr:hypothetical protein [Nevskia sp.]